MKKIINNNKRMVRISTLGIKIGIVRFSTQVVKTGIVSASSVPITKTQRRVSASTLEMKTGWLACTFRYYYTSPKGSTIFTVCNDNTNNKNLDSVISVACYANADTEKIVILKENKGKIGVYK
jgi:hypothetical protein